MLIVESQKDFDIFKKYWDNETSFIIPVWCDLEQHPMNNQLSFLYIKFRDEETDDGVLDIDFILPYNHTDCITFKGDLSKSKQPKTVYNKKGLLQCNLGISNLYDIETELFFKYNKHSEYESITVPLANFYNRLGLRSMIGKSIPIMKWIEVLQKFSKSIDTELFTHTNSWINSVMLPTLANLEQQGIRVDVAKFKEKWPQSVKHLRGDIIYTEYNPYTATSRPSNRHGGVNYSALNKTDGTRSIFLPRDGKIFLQFDYDAYHPRIIGKLIDYELPSTSVHQWLADQYKCSYTESKLKTFQILYGGISKEDLKIPFYAETDKFIRQLYENGTKDGYIKTSTGRKIYLKYIEDLSPQKLFNYLLQSVETELNIEMLGKLAKNNISNVILYTYDSFLFEYNINDTTEKAKKIKKILEKNGFPVKATWGNSYDKV